MLNDSEYILSNLAFQFMAKVINVADRKTDQLNQMIMKIDKFFFLRFENHLLCYLFKYLWIKQIISSLRNN